MNIINDKNNKENKLNSSGSDVSFLSSEDSSTENSKADLSDYETGEDYLIFNEEFDIEDNIDDWKIIVADDDTEVHNMTKIILKDISYEGKSIKMISCYSGEETKRIIKKHPDTAILILDVVMENETAGFDVVKYIRDELKNSTVRIVLRTGEPGQAPEKEVIKNYDINDYKEKTELTAQKFYTTILTSLRSFKNILSIKNNEDSLLKMVSYSTEFNNEHELPSLINKILISFDNILKDEYGGKLLDYALIFSRTKLTEEFLLYDVLGRFDESLIGKHLDIVLSSDLLQHIEKVIESKKYLIIDTFFISYFGSSNNPENLIFVKTKDIIKDTNLSLFNLHNFTIQNTLSNFFQTQEQNRSKASLLSSKNYLTSILDSLTSMMFLIRSDFTIKQINKAVEEHSSLIEKDIIDKNIFAVIPYIKSYSDEIEKVLISKKPSNIVNIERKHLDGSRSFYNASVTPIELVDFSGAVVRIDDNSELKQKEEQLLQSQKMESIGNLAGGLAHDFNNVLGGIVGSASLLKFGLSQKDDIDIEYILSHLGIIENAGKRATDMVRQLLTLSKKQDYKVAPVNLNNSIKHVIKICMNSFDKSVDIKVNYVKTYAVVKADPTQIEQVILNLCINASHAMTFMRGENEKQGGTLKVTLSEFNADSQFCNTNINAEEIKYWKIDIEDTGIGIINDNLSKIFDPFYTTKKDDSGTGLGLSMVYKTINEHNGLILVTSKPNIGTKFSIYLPYVDESFKDELSDGKITIKKNTGIIAILDDEQLIIEAENEMLKNAGFKVISFTKGSEFIEAYKEKYEDIKAVVLDMNMPDMSGKEVFIELKKINPKVKALLASGYRLDSTLTEILDVGFNGFIEKPFTITRFIDAVVKMIEEE